MKKLKILYDYSPACKKKKTGIPVFTHELYVALSKIDSINIEKTICISQYIPTKSWKIYRFFEKFLYHDIYLPFKLKWGKYDLYIENQYMFIPLFKPKKTIILNMVYDIGLILFDDLHTKKHTLNWRKNLPLSIKNSDIIITISHSSKIDIENYLFFINQKGKFVDYIYADSNKIDLKNLDAIGTFNKYEITDPYFLFLGTLEPRKNPLNLLKAFHKFKVTHANSIKLVFAGKKGWLYDDVIAYIQKHNLTSEVIFTGYVTEEEKYYLLKYSKAFIFLSIYEGFGIPPLEAIRFNVPTLLSDITVFHELFKDNVLYANPNDILHIEKMLFEILVNPPKINQEEFLLYNWEKSAQKLLTIVESYVNQSRKNIHEYT